MIFLAKEVVSIKICANAACNTSFSPTRHNQKYCTKECCKFVTNVKMKEQYHENKARRTGKKRLCAECGVTTLSRYNESKVCQVCRLAQRAANRMELLQLVGAA